MSDFICPTCGLAYRTEIALKTWCTPSKHQLMENLKHAASMLDATVLFRGSLYQRCFTLSDQQWDRGIREAKLWFDEADKRGYTPAHGCKMENAMWANRVGIPGEIGFSECFAGMPWKSNEGTYRKADLLGRFGVRTGSEPYHRLWVFDEDDDDWVMVLILPTGGYREYRVEGWLFAKEAKVLLPNGKRKYWQQVRKDRPPCYYVPTAILHDWKLLPEMIEAAK